ncbi:hypothetical protein [Arcobacter sp. F2176]|uniref:HTH-like domain-containing protein n=1 Tax=Arcobacter sp. F2176 TaxID=2044511 RepID=UPI00215A0562|nr:hypothetical protein [Arcobacter sp. F2176]
MDKNELASILKEMYENAKTGKKVSEIHMFGMLYADEIKKISNASEIVKIAGLKSSYSTEVSKGIKIEESLPFRKVFKPNNFEATFNLPKEYQSILKSYLQYFEEFLNDLCIESNVSIQKLGEDTILSIEPKNKDEALEKIADALKAYLCAPILANGVSLDESLQMKTSLAKLYAQCKNLESQMMYKELSIQELSKQIQLRDETINESKRVLIELGVDSKIITQNNVMLLDSLKEIKINGKLTEKKTFFNSIKASVKIPLIFSVGIEVTKKEFDKGKNDK